MKRVAPLIVAVLLLAACGGGGNSDATQIKQVWTSFFSAKTSVAKKVTLLQNGAKYKSTIASLATNPLASQLRAKVSSVTLPQKGSNSAKVVFTIYLGNTPALSNQTGYAIKQGGKWLVDPASLCQLIALQGTMPAICDA